MDIRHHGRCWRPGGGAVPSNAWTSIMETTHSTSHREPCNKDKKSNANRTLIRKRGLSA
jgi:hypothetical protein